MRPSQEHEGPVTVHVTQILSWAAAVVCFVATITVGNSIAKDVNQALGTDYKGIWSLEGNKVWKERERLFPASRKRLLLALALVLAFSFFIATAVLA